MKTAKEFRETALGKDEVGTMYNPIAVDSLMEAYADYNTELYQEMIKVFADERERNNDIINSLTKRITETFNDSVEVQNESLKKKIDTLESDVLKYRKTVRSLIATFHRNNSPSYSDMQKILKFCRDIYDGKSYEEAFQEVTNETNN